MYTLTYPLISLATCSAISLAIALFSYTYTQILVYEPIGNWWYQLLQKWFGGTVFFKPLIDCTKCNAGQIALWLYPVQFVHVCLNASLDSSIWPIHVALQKWHGFDYSVALHLYTIAAAIFAAHILTKIKP